MYNESGVHGTEWSHLNPPSNRIVPSKSSYGERRTLNLQEFLTTFNRFRSQRFGQNVSSLGSRRYPSMPPDQVGAMRRSNFSTINFDSDNYLSKRNLFLRTNQYCFNLPPFFTFALLDGALNKTASHSSAAELQEQEKRAKRENDSRFPGENGFENGINGNGKSLFRQRSSVMSEGQKLNNSLHHRGITRDQFENFVYEVLGGGLMSSAEAKRTVDLIDVSNVPADSVDQGYFAGFGVGKSGFSEGGVGSNSFGGTHPDGTAAENQLNNAVEDSQRTIAYKDFRR
jgi:hypothetical protein